MNNNQLYSPEDAQSGGGNLASLYERMEGKIGADLVSLLLRLRKSNPAQMKTEFERENPRLSLREKEAIIAYFPELWEKKAEFLGGGTFKPSKDEISTRTISSLDNAWTKKEKPLTKTELIRPLTPKLTALYVPEEKKDEYSPEIVQERSTAFLQRRNTVLPTLSMMGRDVAKTLSQMEKSVDIGMLPSSAMEKYFQQVADKLSPEEYEKIRTLFPQVAGIRRVNQIFSNPFTGIVLDAAENATGYPKTKSEKNYEENKDLSLDSLSFYEEMENGNKIFYKATDKNGFIVDQYALPEAHFGDMGSDRNGCGWISVFNAEKLLGKNKSASDVMSEMENGVLFNGELGTNPEAVARYFANQGYQVEMSDDPKKFSAMAKNADANIYMSVRPGDTDKLMKFQFTSFKEFPTGHFVAFAPSGATAGDEILYRTFNSGTEKWNAEHRNGKTIFEKQYADVRTLPELLNAEKTVWDILISIKKHH